MVRTLIVMLLCCVDALALAQAQPQPSIIINNALAAKFAPLLRFDSGSAGYSYPMSADVYYREVVATGNTGRLENNDLGTLRQGNIPIYYQLRQFGTQLRIRYWFFYGYQHPCFGNLGWHHGDWEDVTVIVTADGNSVAAVQFGQHGGRYLRISGPRDAPCTAAGHCDGPRGFETYNGTHPVAYIGRSTHGTYHDASPGLPGIAACTYYADPRDGRGPTFEAWRQVLVSLDGNGESWLARDRQRNFPWGPDGVNTHPTVATFPTDACTGNALQGLDNAGCYKSECLSGDDQAVGTCIRECRPGYTNIALMCSRSNPPGRYNRLEGNGKYRYAFRIPQTDVGLARRRRDDSEWTVP